MLPELNLLRAKNSSKVQPISIGRTRMKLRPKSFVLAPAEVGV